MWLFLKVFMTLTLTLYQVTLGCTFNRLRHLWPNLLARCVRLFFCIKTVTKREYTFGLKKAKSDIDFYIRYKFIFLLVIHCHVVSISCINKNAWNCVQTVLFYKLGESPKERSEWKWKNPFLRWMMWPWIMYLKRKYYCVTLNTIHS